jgi:DNA invertase Pin-like site-specific DNA recombinase
LLSRVLCAHLAITALRPCLLSSSLLSFAALALPPFRPSATACGFFRPILELYYVAVCNILFALYVAVRIVKIGGNHSVRNDDSEHPKRAAVYARISTTNHGQDPEVQLRELREYCQRRSSHIFDEYVDKGISGCRERRPALDKLLTDCRKRLVDAVVVYRYDRFARSLRQLVNALEEFRSLGIDFISLHEGVDTSTPNGRLIFGIFASIAEFERELIRDRVRSGIAAARSRGKRLGRPRVIVNIARVADLRAQGCSWAEIKAELGVSKGTAQRAIAGLPKIV